MSHAERPSKQATFAWRIPEDGKWWDDEDDAEETPPEPWRPGDSPAPWLP